MTVRDVFGTANIKDTLGDAAVEQAVRAWLAEGVELGGLQEFGRHRDRILDKIGAHLEHGRGKGGGGPLVWNRTRYQPARAIKTKTLVGGGFVGRLPGRRSKLGPSYATVGVFEDEVLGGKVAAINVHLTAEVQHGAGYRTDRAHSARVRRHKAERRALRRLILAHRIRGNRPVVFGDTNFDNMPCPPLVSCWHRRPGGTLGSRAVDIIYTPDAPDSVKTLHNASDHRSVVATYRRKP